MQSRKKKTRRINKSYVKNTNKYNRTRKNGSGPTLSKVKRRQNVKFGNDAIHVFDNRITSETEPESVQSIIQKCPDFRFIRPIHFPCRYRNTIFENVSDYNEWIRIKIEKNRGIDVIKHNADIRKQLDEIGQWKPRRKINTPLVVRADISSTSPSPPDLVNFSNDSLRFRKNVNNRIFEGLTDEVI
jgi:hypothetical protein